MEHAKPLPQNFVQRFHGWKATTHADNASWYRKLADEGQRPRAMVITCCDSRIHVSSIFEAEQGELFVHRNIANLVPPFQPDCGLHGTPAAVEYAVTALKVPHLIVIGHSQCGGVAGCRDMCEDKAPALQDPNSFVGRWLGILRPSYEKVADIPDLDDRTRALEQQAVITSLENLMTFPFVADAVAKEELSLHGIWYDIGTGDLDWYNGQDGQFHTL
ncbi:MAG: carbonic anhydrase [Pseudomonadota bacterium]